MLRRSDCYSVLFVRICQHPPSDKLWAPYLTTILLLCRLGLCVIMWLYCDGNNSACTLNPPVLMILVLSRKCYIWTLIDRYTDYCFCCRIRFSWLELRTVNLFSNEYTIDTIQYNRRCRGCAPLLCPIASLLWRGDKMCELLASSEVQTYST